MSLDSLVFALAILGYSALGLSTVLCAQKRGNRWVASATAFLVLCHVFGIWAHRFDWSLAEATRNGWRGFFLFHLALAMIVAAAVWRRRSSLLTHAAFLVVTGGAVGAVFKYEFVAYLKIPVLGIAGATLAIAAAAHLGRRREARRE